MELFSEKLVLVLSLFARGAINSNQLREYLAERFFTNEPDKPLDHSIIGDMEIALAEYEREDRSLEDVRKVAGNLSRSAVSIAQQLGTTIAQEPLLALA